MAIVRERESNGVPGVPILLLLLAPGGAEIWGLVLVIRAENPPAIIGLALMIALTAFAAVGSWSSAASAAPHQ